MKYDIPWVPSVHPFVLVSHSHFSSSSAGGVTYLSDLEAYFFMVAQFQPGLPSFSISMKTISY